MLTGAGISAESGLKTFRDADGLWEGHDVTEVATFEAWQRNPALVLEFYNQRRRAVVAAEPNPAHHALVQLEEAYSVSIVTQNVDDLHERAGSTSVLHLHGEIRKARSTEDAEYVREISGTELNLGDRCPAGAQLRPHIVWFGESVPLMDEAIALAQEADIFMVVGTSLAVYPAAGLIDYVARGTRVFVIDPHLPPLRKQPHLEAIAEKASTAVPRIVNDLLKKA